MVKTRMGGGEMWLCVFRDLSKNTFGASSHHRKHDPIRHGGPDSSLLIESEFEKSSRSWARMKKFTPSGFPDLLGIIVRLLDHGRSSNVPESC